MADVDGAHISALLLRLFVMYFPFLIEAGMVYKAVPPLYGIKEGKKTKYFTDNLEYVKYIQKLFLSKHTFGDSKKNPLNPTQVTKFFVKNADYVYFLEKLANTYAVDPGLLELVLNHYVINNREFKFDKLKKEVKAAYRFMDAEKINGTIVVKGSIDKSNMIIIRDTFLNDCKVITDIIEDNDSVTYTIDNKPATIYQVMKTYENSMPANRQRYKGLGEMGTGELGESTLLPENRTLVRYTMESAKDAINFVREYESDSKKILKEVKHVDREMLLD